MAEPILNTIETAVKSSPVTRYIIRKGRHEPVVAFTDSRNNYDVGVNLWWDGDIEVDCCTNLTREEALKLAAALIEAASVKITVKP